MFGIEFVRHPASGMYLCHTYLITTFKIYRKYHPRYQTSEFSYSLISALAPKLPYRSGPSIGSEAFGHLRGKQIIILDQTFFFFK